MLSREELQREASSAGFQPESFEKVLRLTRTEVDFLSRLNDKGEIVADLLTVDPRLQTLIAAHPMLNWKAHNVREHRSTR